MVTALVLVIGGWLVFGFEKYVEGIATRVYANEGIPQNRVAAIENAVTRIEANLENVEGDVGDIKADLRNIVTILSGDR